MQTAKMTGCGSVLWMAPEILLGRTYNEKVDVFGFAMCLVELIDCHLPWHQYKGGSARVPDRVGRRERPEKQLAHPSLSPAMKALVYACWAHSPSDRPAFGDIVRRLESMQLPHEARAHFAETVLGGSE